MRRIPIRIKLAAALAVPLIALATVTALEVASTSRAVDQVREQTDLARAVVGPAGLITTVQNERTWAIVELVGFDDAVTVQVDGYEQTRADSDEAIDEMRADVEARGGTVARTLGPALEGLDEIERIRADIDDSTAPRDLSNVEFTREIFTRYTDLVDPLFAATTRLSFEVDDSELRQGTRLADTVTRQIETMSQMMILTLANALVSPGGVDEPSEISEISRQHADFQRQAEAMRSASGPYAEIARDLFPAELTDNASASVDEALATGRVSDLDSVLASLNVPREEGYVGYQNAVHRAVEARADHLNGRAESQRLLFGGLALASVTAAAVLTWLVSRSITRPLRSLTVQAKEMAERRLPDAVLSILERPLGDDVEVPPVVPVDIRTRDEVADVADALNTVQDSALELAVEQAVLRRNIADSFVNLGRRNQNLLGRQLDFITELETNETDPDTLGALFRLDHLATRMRRNAESLLVLAGIDPPRKWAAPVRLTDVIRSALGEVENYQRVVLRGVEPATVVGAVAADLAHLVAELIENALTFSPPDRSVDIRGALRADGGYSLAVMDAGFGMPAADLEQANRRLAGAESFTVAPSKYLGHYVAGNLAARHGIQLRLDHSPGSGITASIDLPDRLLTVEAANTGGLSTDARENRAARPARALVAPAGAPAGPWAPAPGAPAASGAGAVAPAAAGPDGRPVDGGPSVPPAAFPGPAGPGPMAPAPPAGPGAPPLPAGPWPVPGNPGAPGFGPPGQPAGPGPVAPPQPAAPAAAAQPSHTVNGLVKRVPKRETPPAHRAAPPAPSGELLDALRSHTGQGPDARRDAAPTAGPGEGSQGPTTAGGLTRRVRDAAPAAGPGDGSQGPTTAGGLTRRVRGAQLPTSQPRALRRGNGQPPADQGPGPAQGRAGATPRGAGGDGPARDVYGYLSSFTSGVQRGLDESRRNRGM